MGIKITAEDVVLPETQGWGVLRNAGADSEYRAGDIGRFPRHEEHSAVEALEDTVYVWTRGDTPPEPAYRSS